MKALKVLAAWCGGAVVVGAVAGCGSHEMKGCKEEFFTPEDQVKSVERINGEMATAGAKEDATLYRHHFENEELNGVGRTKLRLMAKDHKAGQPLVVYVPSLAAGGEMAGRRGAVERYLGEQGIAAGDVRVVAGPNPNVKASAQAGLDTLVKTSSDYESKKGSAYKVEGSENSPAGAGSTSQGGGM